MSCIICADLNIAFCSVSHMELHVAIQVIDLIHVLLSQILFPKRNCGLSFGLSFCVVPLMLLHEKLE